MTDRTARNVICGKPHAHSRGMPLESAMILILVAVLFGLFGFFLLVARAKAEEPARNCDSVIAVLAVAYEERGEELARSIQLPQGTVQALLGNPRTGTWTLLLINEGPEVDQACIVTQSGDRA